MKLVYNSGWLANISDCLVNKLTYSVCSVDLSSNNYFQLDCIDLPVNVAVNLVNIPVK